MDLKKKRATGDEAFEILSQGRSKNFKSAFNTRMP